MQGEKRHGAQIWLHSLNILSQESSAIPKLLLKDFLKCKPSHSYSMFQDPCLSRATLLLNCHRCTTNQVSISDPWSSLLSLYREKCLWNVQFNHSDPSCAIMTSDAPEKCKSTCPTQRGEVSMKGRATEKCNIIEYPLKDKIPYNIT